MGRLSVRGHGSGRTLADGPPGGSPVPERSSTVTPPAESPSSTERMPPPPATSDLSGRLTAPGGPRPSAGAQGDGGDSADAEHRPTLDGLGATISLGTAERAAWSLVWLTTIIGGLGLWGSWSAWPPSAVVAPLFVLVGVGGLAASWIVRTPRSPILQIGALASVVGWTLAQQGIGIHLRQYYSTDSGAFNQAAARLLLHGQNPYTSTMASAARLLQHPADNWTYTVAGGFVDHVSYPAGSFLLPWPALALGFNHAVVDWIDLFAWLITGVLIFALLPRSLRWLGCLILSIPIFAAIFGSGGTDAAFLPFMVLAVWRWDRFALGRAGGLVRWMGPVSLGLACSIKQTPWFCVPFLVLGIALEARRAGRSPLRTAASYTAVVVAVFTVVNGPFIVWNPAAWARGTFLPFVDPLVADGQGLVTLVLHGFSHGVSLPLLTVAGLLVLLSLLVTFVVAYPVMKRIWLILLPVSFFVAPRSLSSYLLDLFPAALVAAVSVAPGATPAVLRTSPRARSAALLGAIGSAVAAVVVAALAFTAVPLQLAIRSSVASPNASALEAVTVAVHNNTAGVLDPHFMVTIGSDHPDGFWLPADGRQVVLPPHASEVVTLYPTHRIGAPGHHSYWLVAAYTTAPEALSTSPLQQWQLGSP